MIQQIAAWFKNAKQTVIGWFKKEETIIDSDVTAFLNIVHVRAIERAQDLRSAIETEITLIEDKYKTEYNTLLAEVDAFMAKVKLSAATTVKSAEISTCDAVLRVLTSFNTEIENLMDKAAAIDNKIKGSGPQVN